MYKYQMRKELIKNIVYVALILLLAIYSTYHIYHKFQKERHIDFNSESLDVVYHESTGDKITIKKIVPVTDSVGLSSKSYNITIKNNLTEKIGYKLKILDDLDVVIEDECEEFLIPKEDIRISIKVNKKDNVIYSLDELEDGILLEDYIAALDKNTVAIRLWINQDTDLPIRSNLHYHGIVQVIEENDIVATTC